MNDVRENLPVVGMVGGGQLARMTHQAAITLGQSLRVLVDSPDDSAALVAPDARQGDYRNLETLREFATGCAALTFDHEHVPTEHLAALDTEGFVLRPPPTALRYAQDKLAMRRRFAELDFPIPAFIEARKPEKIAAFGEQHGWPLIVKAPRGGYDGKGVWVVDDVSSAANLLNTYPSLLVEQKVPIIRELAAVVARSPHGQVATWPVVETVQNDGVCVEVIAPAQELDESVGIEVQRLAVRIATALDVVGVMAVELFQTEDEILVNELAMRPHNSAHWTIDGCVTSQFEQHLRAVLDYPLGSTRMTAPVVVMANVFGGEPYVDAAASTEASGTSDALSLDGIKSPARKGLDERLHDVLAIDPAARVHLYGKQPRPGRKLGHVTVLDDDVSRARRRARRAAHLLAGIDAEDAKLGGSSE